MSDAPKTDGGPAFPTGSGTLSDGEHTAEHIATEPGMSLRDWFAGQALMGMHARDTFDDGQATPKQRARLAYIDADALLRARTGDDDE